MITRSRWSWVDKYDFTAMRTRGTLEERKPKAEGQGLTSKANDQLIQSDQKNRALGGVRIPCHFFGALAFIIKDAHSHPPVTYPAAEANYFGGLISPCKAVGQFSCRTFLIKSSDLHSPSPTYIY